MFDDHEKPTVRVDRPVELAPPCPKLRRYRTELAPPCPKLRRYRTERGGWSIDSGGERVWDPAIEIFRDEEETHDPK